MDIRVIVGNPNPGGRTTTVAEAVAARIRASLAGDHTTHTHELAGVADQLFAWGSPEVDELVEAVRGTDVAVFACPTYKASFTGLLKSFLDRFPNNGLADVTAIPVMLGAAPIHQLAVETQLRPVLVELAATVPSKGLFVVDSRMDRLEDTIDEWWSLARRPIVRAAGRRRLETPEPSA